MPAFTLYGARGSSNTDRVRLTLAEGGIKDYEVVFLNLQNGEQRVSGSLSSEVAVPLLAYTSRLSHQASRAVFLPSEKANSTVYSPKNTSNGILGAKYLCWSPPAI